jgi:hypothetical protein
LILGWSKEIAGPLSNILSTVTVLLIGLGLAIGIGSAIASVRSARVSMTPTLAVAILFCVPAFELTMLGMGYNARHRLAMVPALFVLAGLGFAGVVNVFEPAKQRIGPWLIVPLVAMLAVRAADSALIEKISRSEGEWTIDYERRQVIAEDLALRLGMPPDLYATRTFWWWMGWAIDPAIYSETYRRVVAAHGPRTSRLTPDQYVVVTEGAELPPFLQRILDREETHPGPGMHIHVARLKKTTPIVEPSGNADTGVRLQPFLEQVDQLRSQPQGVARVGHEQLGSGRRDLFLISLANGRIKLIVTIEQTRCKSARGYAGASTHRRSTVITGRPRRFGVRGSF